MTKEAVWLRDIGTADDPCWVVCNKIDPGAVEFRAFLRSAPEAGLPQRKISIGLTEIAAHIRSWLEWNKKDRDQEHLVTDDGTHIMALPVPSWPSRGALQEWIRVIVAADVAISAPVADEGRREKILQAMIAHFKSIVEAGSDMPFAETKVHLPMISFEGYADAIVAAIEGE